MLNIKVILSSVREGRQGEKVAKWILSQIKQQKDLSVELVDLKDWPFPYFNNPLSPSHPDFKQNSEMGSKWEEMVKQTDGFIIVTPEYNHGYPASLKSALDQTYYPWNKKAVGFVSYGSVGGARAVEQLRQVAVELQMAPIREAVHIMGVRSAIDENGQPQDQALNDKAKGFIESLIWWTKALKDARTS